MTIHRVTFSFERVGDMSAPGPAFPDDEVAPRVEDQVGDARLIGVLDHLCREGSTHVETGRVIHTEHGIPPVGRLLGFRVDRHRLVVDLWFHVCGPRGPVVVTTPKFRAEVTELTDAHRERLRDALSTWSRRDVVPKTAWVEHLYVRFKRTLSRGAIERFVREL